MARFPTRPLLVAAALIGSALGGTASAVIYDDFDGGGLDPGLWTVSDDSGVFSMSGGLLDMIAATPDTAYMRSTLQIQGDADIRLDFRDFASTATTRLNSVSLVMEVDEQNYVYIGRGQGWIEEGGIADVMMAGDMLAGAPRFSASTTVSGTAGLLRIVRTGSTIEAFYDVGSGWVSLYNGGGMFTGDVRIFIVFENQEGSLSLASDRVEYVGEPVGVRARSIGGIRASFR